MKRQQEEPFLYLSHFLLPSFILHPLVPQFRAKSLGLPTYFQNVCHVKTAFAENTRGKSLQLQLLFRYFQSNFKLQSLVLTSEFSFRPSGCCLSLDLIKLSLDSFYFQSVFRSVTSFVDQSFGYSFRVCMFLNLVRQISLLSICCLISCRNW